MEELTDGLFKDLTNELDNTKKSISKLIFNKDKQIDNIKVELQKTYSKIDNLNNTISSLKKQLKEHSFSNDILLPNSIMTDKYIYGIPDLKKRKEESIFDSINYFNKCCPYCDNSLYEGHIRSKIEIDHFFPISKGGQDFPWNILPICKNCNRKKRNKMPYDFLDKERYQKCYNYLSNIKNNFSNSIENEIINIELIKNIITKHEDNLSKFRNVEPLIEIIKIVIPDYKDNCLNEEIQCLLKIFTAKIRYENYDNKIEETTLLNLLNRAAGTTENTPDKRAKKELYKYGINYSQKKDKVYLAQNYEWIKEMLDGTPWKFNYARTLMRLDFVNNKTIVCGFGPYHNGRAIEMNADYILRLSVDK